MLFNIYCSHYASPYEGEHRCSLSIEPGVYLYNFVVDGTERYNPSLPFQADQVGNIFNLLIVEVIAKII
jgi:hypothetical protein